MIINRAGNFGFSISEWNRMSTIQKIWVGFRQFFWTAHEELCRTTDLTVKDAGMHHANMVCNVVTRMQKVLQQEQSLIETPPVVSEPSKHVGNAVQNTQQQ